MPIFSGLFRSVIVGDVSISHMTSAKLSKYPREISTGPVKAKLPLDVYYKRLEN